ncbi:hypothetical protein L1887_56347 [Cichorium endivia]|nr:hypothetical protein L1887_56347 [Cichorium endivia]
MGDRGGAAVFTTFSRNGWPSDWRACMVDILGPVITIIGADAQVHMAEDTRGAARVVPSFALASIVVSRGECDYDGDSDRFSGNASLMFHNRRRSVVRESAKRDRHPLTDQGPSPVTRAFPSTPTSPRFCRRPGHVDFVEPDGPDLFLSNSYRPIFGFFCNAIAFIFLCVVLGEYAHDRGVGHTADHPQTVMMFFPTTPNPRPADMNWSVVMYGFVTVVMLVFYFRRAKYIFDGPVTTVSSQWDTATTSECATAVAVDLWIEKHGRTNSGDDEAYGEQLFLSVGLCQNGIDVRGVASRNVWNWKIVFDSAR